MCGQSYSKQGIVILASGPLDLVAKSKGEHQDRDSNMREAGRKGAQALRGEI
jgi:hypothetical protein